MVLRKVGNYVTRKIAGETLVVPIRANAAEIDSVLVFNEVGAAIWTQLDARSDAGAIAWAIAQEFDVSEATAKLDVDRFLAELIDAGMIEAGCD